MHKHSRMPQSINYLFMFQEENVKINVSTLSQMHGSVALVCSLI